MTHITRSAQVLRYLLQVASGVGRHRLAQYVYLADVEARRYLGRPISDLEYGFTARGPFDANGFAEAMNELESLGLVRENQIPCGEYMSSELVPTGSPVEFSFTATEAEVLRYVATTFLSTSMRDFIDDVVYATEPMVDAEPGRPLPMDRANGSPGADLTFSLERVLRGEASALAGRTRPWVQARDEFRAAS